MNLSSKELLQRFPKVRCRAARGHSVLIENPKKKGFRSMVCEEVISHFFMIFIQPPLS
jgi:hypothetical protein